MWSVHPMGEEVKAQIGVTRVRWGVAEIMDLCGYRPCLHAAGLVDHLHIGEIGTVVEWVWVPDVEDFVTGEGGKPNGPGGVVDHGVEGNCWWYVVCRDPHFE
jgi:hypothetical protein